MVASVDGRAVLDEEPSPPAVEKYIGFLLSQLSSTNDHHTFEAIAVRIARRRLSLNILLANGPVSAGGDQQRDAESYFTRIPEELPASTRRGLSSSPIVIACTTQATGLRAKILADIEGICAADAEPVERIAIFSVSQVPAAVVHEIQRTARDRFDVGVDVFSGAQLSTLLAEPDLFWIAHHYLDVPNSMAPPQDGRGTPEWYGALLERFRNNGGPEAMTPGILGETVSGVRQAMWDPSANADLPEWLGYLRPFTDARNPDGTESELSFAACYETSVATLRGMGTLSGAENLLRRAVDHGLRSDDFTEISDASTLLGYWGGAWVSGVADGDAHAISGVVRLMRHHAEEVLDATDAATYPLRSTTLIETLARLCFIPNWGALQDANGRPERVDNDRRAGDDLADVQIDLSKLADADEIDFDGAMGYLRRLAEAIPAARAFPVDTISKLFQMFAPALANREGYEEVRDSLDEAVSSVMGDNARAERLRDRAMSFVKAGRPLEALDDLHQAKEAWFHGETLRGAIVVMRFLAKIYSNLGLMFAAKLYAGAAASIAMTSAQEDAKSVVPEALLDLMHYAQKSGAWFDAAAFGHIAVVGRHALTANPFDYDNDDGFVTAEVNAAASLAYLRRYWPQLEAPYVALFEPTGWVDRIRDGADGLSDAIGWTVEEFVRLANDQYANPLLHDLGAERRIEFEALGVRWILMCANREADVLAAEGLCAALQVTLADIARDAPDLFHCRVELEVELTASQDLRDNVFELDVDGPSVHGRVVITQAGDDYVQRATELIGLVMPTIDSAYAHESPELFEMLKHALSRGLPNRVAFAHPYEKLVGMLPAQHYAALSSLPRPDDIGEFTPAPDGPLAASEADGEAYDSRRARELIANRYDAAWTRFGTTLAAMAADPRWPTYVRGLRADGWLDWQILLGITNQVANWRLADAGVDLRSAAREVVSRIVQASEADGAPVPPLDIMFGDTIRTFMDMQVVTVAKTWSLHPPAAGDLVATLRELLVRRYRYSTDDVEHPDLLDLLDDQGALRPII